MCDHSKIRVFLLRILMSQPKFFKQNHFLQCYSTYSFWWLLIFLIPVVLVLSIAMDLFNVLMLFYADDIAIFATWITDASGKTSDFRRILKLNTNKTKLMFFSNYLTPWFSRNTQIHREFDIHTHMIWNHTVSRPWRTLFGKYSNMCKVHSEP